MARGMCQVRKSNVENEKKKEERKDMMMKKCIYSF